MRKRERERGEIEKERQGEGGRDSRLILVEFVPEDYSLDLATVTVRRVAMSAADGKGWN